MHPVLAKFKTTVAFTLIILILCTVRAPVASAAESGSCGQELFWSYSGGTLYITGSGEMDDFTEPDMAPWYSMRKEITRVVFSEKVTSVGNLAFYECENLKAIALPDSVRQVGAYAFAACEELEFLDLGETIREIDTAAFYGCINLKAVTLPYSVEILGDQAFYRCESLYTVTVPDYVSDMGTSVFAYCKSLVKAEINAKLKSVPEWTFYGCEHLTAVTLADTVEEVDNYAFKKCDVLLNVFFQGDEDQTEKIRKGIETDVPSFQAAGYVGSGVISDVNMSTDRETGENITVTEGENMTLVTVPNQVLITVENEDGWKNAAEAVQETDGDVTVYIKDGVELNENFLKVMAERKNELTVVSPDGSVWIIDCGEIDKDNLSGNYSYSYNIEEADTEACQQLGTDSCYKLTFNGKAEINAEVVVRLPSAQTGANAFLYQKERNGDYTRLQAVAVDKDGNAHFYLASVDDETEYIIGLNVPGESVADVIIPDELSSQYNDAIARLEKIDYVVTGVESSWGLTIGQVLLIMLGIIVVCGLGIGGAMFVMNKRKLKNAGNGDNT